MVCGPNWPFYSWIVILDCWDRLYTCYVSQVELPVQRRLCPIFVRNVGSPDIHECFLGLTGSQRTPGFWGVTIPSCDAPSPFLATIHHVYYNTKKKPFKSQYNTSIAIQFVVLQYNSSHCTPIEIQSVMLQYNSSHCTLLQYTLLCCNTILATALPILQYNATPCNTIFPHAAIQSSQASQPAIQ